MAVDDSISSHAKRLKLIQKNKNKQTEIRGESDKMGHSDYDGTDYASLHKIQQETKPMKVRESKLEVQPQIKDKVKEHKNLSQASKKKKIMHLAQEISFNENIDYEEAKKKAEDRLKDQKLDNQQTIDPSKLAESYNSHMLGQKK